MLIGQLPGTFHNGDKIHALSFDKGLGEMNLQLAAWDGDTMTGTLVFNLEHEDKGHTLDTVGR